MTATLLPNLLGLFSLLGEIVYRFLPAAIPTIHSIVQRCRTEAKQLHRDIRRHYFPIKNNMLRTTSVFILLLTCSPSTIIRLIVSINIWKSVQRMAGRLFSHIGKKVIENLPSFADSNAPTSIVRITYGLAIGASSDHIYPTTVSRRMGHGMPATGFAGLSVILQKTSARFRVPTLQRTLWNEYLVSTFAACLRNVIKTIVSFWDCLGISDDSQSPKRLPNFNRFSSWHMSLKVFI